MPIANGSDSGSGGGGGGGARAAARFSARRVARLKEEGGVDGADATASESVVSGAFQVRRSSWIDQGSEPPRRLSDISRQSLRKQWRIRLPGETGRELDRVLGGGVVPGSLMLIGGEPGIGKSTLLLQIADMVSRRSTADASKRDTLSMDRERDTLSIEGEDSPSSSPAVSSPSYDRAYERENGDIIDHPVLYVSGEESAEQVGSRAERMGIGNNPHVYLHAATRLDSILDAVLTLRPSALIVDSIQTVYLDDLPSSAGSVVQVRECASALLQVAKRERMPVFLVGHVTKSGDIAGPRVLEHIVDVVVYMEGGRQQSLRLVRCVKNRYGATDEVGVFSMEEAGLRAVPNPSAMFLSQRSGVPSTSSVSSGVTVIMEGSRPLLMEVQALCSPIAPGNPAPPLRSPTGVRKERLWLLLAVLGKHTDMRPYRVDVHLNVTGGLTISEPAADLAIVAALASSYYERPIPPNTALLGEVGLGGELRPVYQLEKRILEAVKLGFNTVIIPSGSNVRRSGRLAADDCQIIECRTVLEACEAALGPDLKTRRRGFRKVHRPRNDDDDDNDDVVDVNY